MPFKQATYSDANRSISNKQNRDAVLDLRVLFDQHYSAVYRIAFQMTQSTHEAEDIAQDVFLKLHKKLSLFRKDAAVSTWVYRITVNTTLDHLRWKKLHRLRQLPSTTLDYFSTEKEETSAPLNKTLQHALKQVKPAYRATIILRDIEGFSYHEISEILGISTGTVASRLNRGYKQMKKILKKHNFDEKQFGEER